MTISVKKTIDIEVRYVENFTLLKEDMAVVQPSAEDGFLRSFNLQTGNFSNFEANLNGLAAVNFGQKPALALSDR